MIWNIIGIAIIIGFVVAVSVVGTLFIGAAAGIIAIFALGIGTLWPFLLVAAVVYILSRSRRQQVHG